MADEVKTEEVYLIKEHALVKKCFDVYLLNEVADSHHYVDLFHKLDQAGENDEFHIHINNRGGLVSTGVQLIDHWSKSKATVVTFVEAPVYSMGTTLSLAGDKIHFGEHTFLMQHDYSSGLRGKGSEITKQVDATAKWIHKFQKDVTGWFFTDAEFDKIFSGQDVYIDSKEAIKRAKKAGRLA